jgi:allophanate hydrolase subunit 1
MLFLILGIDMYLFQQSFFSVLVKLFIQEKGTNEWMINMGVFAGFLYSLVVDYRLRKNKKQQKKKTET